MFRHCTAEFHLQIFDIALSAHCADVVFPWENNRADAIRPYMACATELPSGYFVHCKMFDGVMSAQCADVVFPMGKQPGG